MTNAGQVKKPRAEAFQATMLASLIAPEQVRKDR